MTDLIKICLIFFQGLVLVILTSCVSVQVPFGPARKVERTLITKPAIPFVAFTSNTADEAWISEKTGNTISYLSECKKTNENIEDVAADAANAIEHSRIVKSSRGLIDTKQSAELLVSGKVDSHKVKMAIAVFQSKNCLISLIYGGLDEKFDEELNEFESFKNGFHTP